MQTLQAWLWLQQAVLFKGAQLLSAPVMCHDALVTVWQCCLPPRLAGTWSRRLHSHAKGVTNSL